jgi:hypothetical protein
MKPYADNVLFGGEVLDDETPSVTTTDMGSGKLPKDGFRQAAWLSRWLAIYLPFWLIVSLGGVATVLYVLSVVGPWARILYELSAP